MERSDWRRCSWVWFADVQTAVGGTLGGLRSRGGERVRLSAGGGRLRWRASVRGVSARDCDARTRRGHAGHERRPGAPVRRRRPGSRGRVRSIGHGESAGHGRARGQAGGWASPSGRVRPAAGVRLSEGREEHRRGVGLGRVRRRLAGGWSAQGGVGGVGARRAVGGQGVFMVIEQAAARGGLLSSQCVRSNRSDLAQGRPEALLAN